MDLDSFKLLVKQLKNDDVRNRPINKGPVTPQGEPFGLVELGNMEITLVHGKMGLVKALGVKSKLFVDGRVLNLTEKKIAIASLNGLVILSVRGIQYVAVVWDPTDPTLVSRITDYIQTNRNKATL
ncbi:hypothetical protein HK100_008938, partial [Physocladia obscura]